MKKTKKTLRETTTDKAGLVDLATFRKQVEKSFPTAVELAHLAASLGGQMPKPTTHHNLAEQAYGLWKACDAVRKDKVARAALYEEATQIGRISNLKFGPEPSAFPVKLKELLKLALPKKRKETRMNICREYARAEVQRVHGREATERDINATIAVWDKDGFHPDHYLDSQEALQTISEQKDKDARVRRAKAGASGLRAKRELGRDKQI